MQKITPCLWLDNQAEEAAQYYTSIFKNSKIGTISRYTADGPGPEGSAMMVIFELDGQEFQALNGGPEFKFSEAISFSVSCETQEEVDYFWEKLTAGGEAGPCGWLKDKFGLSWQIVPSIIGELMTNGNPEQVRRVMQEVFKMSKIDIATLKQAYEQG